jgi:hypothetical protein
MNKLLLRLSVAAIVLLGAVFAFAAYRQPAFFLDFMNLRYCG